MICLICGEPIGQEQPIPVAEIRFTPIVPWVPGLTENKLGPTILQNRICCQSCYKTLLENDFKAIKEAGKISRN